MSTSVQSDLDLQRRIAADPNVQAILRDPRYTTPMLRDQAVNNYLTNDPRSPAHAVMGFGAANQQGNRGTYTYHYDPVTGRLAKVTLGPQHWWSDPGVVGPIVAGTAMAGFGAAGAAGGGGGTASGGAAAGLNADGTLAATMGAPAGLTVGPTAAGGGGVLGLLKTGGSKALDFLTSKKGVGDLASLAALLPMLARGGGGGSTPFADLKLPADDPALLNDTRAAYALQQKRVHQTQPAFDALVSQAYGMTPTRYRGAPPEGLPAAATEAPSGGYGYRGPQFG